MGGKSLAGPIQSRQRQGVADRYVCQRAKKGVDFAILAHFRQAHISATRCQLSEAALCIC